MRRIAALLVLLVLGVVSLPARRVGARRPEHRELDPPGAAAAHGRRRGARRLGWCPTWPARGRRDGAASWSAPPSAWAAAVLGLVIFFLLLNGISGA